MALAVVDPEDLVNWHHPQNFPWLDTPPFSPAYPGSSGQAAWLHMLTPPLDL